MKDSTFYWILGCGFVAAAPIIIASFLCATYFDTIRVNSGYSKTNCTVVNIVVWNDYCSDWLGDINHDSTCYWGTLYIQLNISRVYNRSRNIYYNEKNKNVAEKIFSRYTIGEIITCYYNREYTEKVSLELSDDKYLLDFSIVLFVFAAILIMFCPLRFIYLRMKKSQDVDPDSEYGTFAGTSSQSVPNINIDIAGS